MVVLTSLASPAPRTDPSAALRHRQSPLIVCWSSLQCLAARRLNQAQQIKHVFTRFMAATYCKYIYSSSVLQLVCETDVTHYQQNHIIKILIWRIPLSETVGKTVAHQAKMFWNNQVEHVSVAFFFFFWSCVSTWHCIFSTGRNTVCPNCTGCVMVLKHMVKYIRCEVFLVVVATVCYHW